MASFTKWIPKGWIWQISAFWNQKYSLDHSTASFNAPSIGAELPQKSFRAEQVAECWVRKEPAWHHHGWCDGFSTLAQGKGSWWCMVHVKSLFYLFWLHDMILSHKLFFPGDWLGKNLSIRTCIQHSVHLAKLTWAGMRTEWLSLAAVGTF